MKIIIKGICNIILVTGFILGLILMCSEPSIEASTMEILKVNGGGIAIVCISLLLLSWINKADDEYEEKGGKYYGIR